MNEPSWCSVGDVICTRPEVVNADATATEVAQRMCQAEVDQVLVLDEGAVAGVLTEHDLVHRVLAEGLNPSAVRVGALCTVPVRILHADDSVDAALALIRRDAFARFPVVDDGRPVGIVSIADLSSYGDWALPAKGAVVAAEAAQR